MVVTQHQSGFLRCFPNALKLFPQTGATSQQIRFYIIPFKLLCPVIPSAGSHILGATFYRQPAEYRPQVIIKREHNFRIFPCTDYHHVSRTSMQQNPAKIILAYNPQQIPFPNIPIRVLIGYFSDSLTDIIFFCSSGVTSINDKL